MPLHHMAELRADQFAACKPYLARDRHQICAKGLRLLYSAQAVPSQAAMSIYLMCSRASTGMGLRQQHPEPLDQ